jgi:hypothetical protein
MFLSLVAPEPPGPGVDVRSLLDRHLPRFDPAFRALVAATPESEVRLDDPSSLVEAISPAACSHERPGFRSAHGGGVPARRDDRGHRRVGPHGLPGMARAGGPCRPTRCCGALGRHDVEFRRRRRTGAVLVPACVADALKRSPSGHCRAPRARCRRARARARGTGPPGRAAEPMGAWGSTTWPSAFARRGRSRDESARFSSQNAATTASTAEPRVARPSRYGCHSRTRTGRIAAVS